MCPSCGTTTLSRGARTPPPRSAVPRRNWGSVPHPGSSPSHATHNHTTVTGTPHPPAPYSNPIRARTTPCKRLPNLNPDQPTKLKNDNTLMRRALILAGAVAQSGGMYVLEHPMDYGPPRPSIWTTQEIKDLLSNTAGQLTTTDQCTRGHPTKKPTTFGTQSTHSGARADLRTWEPHHHPSLTQTSQVGTGHHASHTPRNHDHFSGTGVRATPDHAGHTATHTTRPRDLCHPPYVLQHPGRLPTTPLSAAPYTHLTSPTTLPGELYIVVGVFQEKTNMMKSPQPRT